MDRHADKSPRDDKKRILGKTRSAQNLTTPQDSRIWVIKSGLCKASAEIRLGRLSHKRAEAIHDLSPKAESQNKKG